MTFKPGMRVRITKDVTSGDAPNLPSHNIKNHTGTIYKKRSYFGWLVRIDGHPGFENRSGCWAVQNFEMEPLLSEQNETFLFLLKQNM